MPEAEGATGKRAASLLPFVHTLSLLCDLTNADRPVLNLLLNTLIDPFIHQRHTTGSLEFFSSVPLSLSLFAGSRLYLRKSVHTYRLRKSSSSQVNKYLIFCRIYKGLDVSFSFFFSQSIRLLLYSLSLSSGAPTWPPRLSSLTPDSGGGGRGGRKFFFSCMRR